MSDLGGAMSGSHPDKAGFDAEDRQALEAYGGAVASQLLRFGSPSRMAQREVPRDVQWPPEDIEMLMALGATHGNVMRDVLMGVVASFEDGRSDVVPMFGDRTVSEEAEASAGSEQRSDAIDAISEQGVGPISLLNHVEHRDASVAAAAGDESSQPPS